VDIITAFLEGIGDATIEITNTAFQVIIDFINGLATAIETNTPLILEACENLATAFLDGIKEYLKIEEGETIAGYVIQGLINGITNGIANVLSAAKDLGRGIIDAINEAMGVESPSKETYASGQYADKGLINGLVSLSGKVISAAKGVGTCAVEGIKSTISGISDVLNSEIQLNPVITPVMDLSNIKNDAETINGLLNSTTAYNLANSQSLSDLQQNAIVQTATTQDNQPLGQNVQFVQNNYSPKALSQLEIYRQTKNQLAMLKGLVTP
jgi:phage-related protein